mgnify:FL=1
MKYFLCILFLLTHSPNYSEKIVTLDLPEVTISYKKTIPDYCLEIACKLDKLGYLSISPETFADYMFIVAKCESNHTLDALNGDQTGLWQHTEATMKKLHMKPPTTLENQAYNYLIFLKAVGKKKLRKVKTSVDLHCYNFAPCRNKDGILSIVNNPGLEALDFDKDSVITKNDLKIFQQKRLK